MRVLLALLLSLAAPAVAKPAEMMLPVAAAPGFTPRADRAYLLVRTLRGSPAPTLMRIPDEAELAAHDAAKAAAFAKAEPELTRRRDAVLAREQAARAAGKPFREIIPPLPSLENFSFVYEDIVNVANLPMGKPVEKSDTGATHLVEVGPGDYVLYGVGFAKALHTCLCLGTIGFSAPAGQVTDLGQVLIAQAWRPSDIPELAGESNLGASVNGHIALWAAAVRPASGQPLPAMLQGQAVRSADYRAVGKFVSPLAFNINRLAALPGVLGYRGGDVIDLRSGGVVPPNFQD